MLGFRKYRNIKFLCRKRIPKRGIGNLLFAEVEKIASGVMTLEVRVSNTNAINFYTKRGFNKALIRKGYYSNGEDAILMVRM